MASDDTPDEFDYETSVEANVAIMRALSEITFMRRMEVLMPLVAEELMRAGVDFSKARLDAQKGGERWNR